MRDLLRASYRSDAGAMAGHGTLAASAGFGLAALIAGTNVALVLGAIAIVLLFAGLGILALFSDSEMEAWLKNMPFGAVDRVRGGPDGELQSDRGRYGKGEAQPYAGWKAHPEKAYYYLMNLLWQPRVKFTGGAVGYQTTLEVRLPNYQAGTSQLEAELILENNILMVDREVGRLSLFSKGEELASAGHSAGVDLSAFWRKAKIEVFKGFNGYRIEFDRELMRKLYTKWLDYNLKFRCRVHPRGKGAMVVPGSDDAFVIPAPAYITTGTGDRAAETPWAEDEVAVRSLRF